VFGPPVLWPLAPKLDEPLESGRAGRAGRGAIPRSSGAETLRDPAPSKVGESGGSSAFAALVVFVLGWIRGIASDLSVGLLVGLFDIDDFGELSWTSLIACFT